MRLLAPLFNAAKKSKRLYSSSALYQTVFQKHGVSLTPEQVSLPQELPKTQHLKAILDKPEVQMKWFEIKKNYSTPQEIDQLSFDLMHISKSAPKI